MLLSKLSLLWLFCTLYFLQLTLAIPQSAAISKPKEEIWSNVFYLATNECFQISMSPLLLLHYQAIGASDVTPPFTRTSRGSLTSTIFWFFIKMLQNCDDSSNLWLIPSEKPFILTDHATIEIQPLTRSHFPKVSCKIESRYLRPTNLLSLRKCLIEVDVPTLIRDFLWR